MTTDGIISRKHPEDAGAPVLSQAHRPRSPCQGAHVRSGWNWLHRSTGGL